MGLTPLDYFNRYPNDKSGFIDAVAGPNGDRTAAGAMYDRFKSMSRSGGGYTPNTSSSSGTSSTSSTSIFGGGSGGDGIISKTLGVLNNIVSGTADIASKIYGSQIGQEGDKGPQSIEKLFDIVRSGGLNPLTILTSGLATVGDEIIDQLKQEAKLRSDINTYTTLTGQLSEDLRTDMIESSITAARYGMNVEDISNFYVQLVENSGKFSLINTKFINSVLPVTKALGLTTQEMANYISEFETIGNAASRTIKDISEATTRSVSLGLNARDITKGMKDNIGKLNEYGFQNGVKGLERMVQTAREFRMNMEDVLGIAEKVMNPEGAVEMSARLQVLGGAFGDFANPLKMMYDATNNVQGLQESLIGAARSLVTYNKEQERFEITGANLRRAREMADAYGMRLGDLTKIGIAASERLQATQALMASSLQMDDKDREFLTNLSRMENGKMSIMVPESIAQKLGVPTEIALDKLDANTAKALLENKKEFEKMSPADMADKQLTVTQQMARDMAVVAQYYRVRAAQTIGGIMDSKKAQEAVNELRAKINETATQKMESNDITLKSRVAQMVNETDFTNMNAQQIGQKIKEVLDSQLNKNNQNTQTQNQTQNQTNQQNQTVLVVKHEFGVTPDVMSEVNRAMMKNPTIVNEWLNKKQPQIQKRVYVY